MTTHEAENEKDPKIDPPKGEPESGAASAEGTGVEPTSTEAQASEAEASDAPEASAEPEASAPEASDAPEASAPEASAEPATGTASTTPATPAAPSKPASKPAQMTPGQRLAAARAAKAAKKTASRGREADELESRAIDTAEVVREKTASYLDTNRRIVWGTIGAVALVAAAFFGFRKWHEGQEQAAGALLEEANRIQLAEIRSEDERASSDDDAPTYATREARAEAALRAYRAVTSQHPRSEAAAWAYVGEGRALLDRGEPGDARAAYQKALEAGDGDSAVARQALEGIGFSYEAEENWDEALSTYEELASLADGAFESLGDYHASRMLLKKGQEDEAKQRLRAALERLRGADAPDAPYLRREVEARLAVLDPSAAQPSSAGGGQLSPEAIQELIRQAQAQQQGQGESP